MLDVLYLRFKKQKSYLRVVDARDTRFDTHKGCVRMVDASYKLFEDCERSGHMF